ncbi:hypothetical protein PNEG_01813 [Pneumocystis murina B123]|uniref:HTH cro/C1-type domain-containing protein n=1 Tax=Pneumocystis murina (strain B123) TaxID=1069680 RepID=M7NS07_PNEMU|nr:hypothetical protein PNEG_01813 [Pneumocystis murina B123]EMR10062.1 hypothetical protein PNEG_01813 [Pneumocystis murina B123]
MGETDWDSVTKIGRGVRSKVTTIRTINEINEARRLGILVNIEKKFSAGSNKAHKTTESQKITKIDRENDIVPIKTSGREVGLAISKARQEKNIKQSELAQKINEKVSVINDYENGKAIPNQQILAKMEKVLGVKLRGSGIGQVLAGSKK